MTKDEVFDLPQTTPLVRMLDGSIGMFLIWPIGTGDREGLCGIQVPGEPEHRWVHHDNLKLEGQTIVETPNASVEGRSTEGAESRSNALLGAQPETGDGK